MVSKGDSVKGTRPPAFQPGQCPVPAAPSTSASCPVVLSPSPGAFSGRLNEVTARGQSFLLLVLVLSSQSELQTSVFTTLDLRSLVPRSEENMKTSKFPQPREGDVVEPPP